MYVKFTKPAYKSQVERPDAEIAQAFGKQGPVPAAQREGNIGSGKGNLGTGESNVGLKNN